MPATVAAHAFHAVRFSEFTLGNGLHVVLHRDARVPLVAVGVMYHVGSKNERPDQRGFAHFFEHLLFEGTRHIARGEFTRLVEDAGGMLNANTTGDRTWYHQVLPSDRLELGLWLESERMLHPRVEAVGIATQRDVVKEEYRQRYADQPYGRILIEVLARAYRVHPYRWPVIGDMGDLDAATEADFQAFHRRFYIPNNAVLVVAGDLDEEFARRRVEAWFGGIPAGPPVVQPAVVEPPLPHEVRDVVHDEVQLPAVVHAYRIPALGQPDLYAVDLVNRLLGGGNSARLPHRLKDVRRLAVHTGAFTLPFEHPGLAVLWAIANSGVGAEPLEHALEEELARVREHGPTADELDRLKTQLETEHTLEFARMGGVAHNLAHAHLLLGDAARVNAELAFYMDLTTADVRDAAQRWFDPARRVALHWLPRNRGPA